MTILTPNFSERAQLNGGGAPLHIVAAHEPLRTEVPAIQGATEPPSQQTNEACSAAGSPGLGSTGEGLEAARPPLKIAMIGTAPSSRMLAPFGDPSWTIWACSPGNMNTLPRVDAWFEVHANLLWPEYESYGRPYIEWLKQQPFPVYMQDQSLVPNAVIFPMRELVAEFGMGFFTSSFTWQMALAIKMGASEIALYGIDMASRDEYIQQRPGFYFFRHEAERRGIKVSAPHESDIMQWPALYGYVDSTPFGRKIRARSKEIADRITPMTTQRDQLVHNITYLQGAKEDIDYFDSIWSGVSNEMSILRYDNAMLAMRVRELEAREAMQMQRTAPLTSEVVLYDPAIMDNPVVVKPKRRRRRKKLAEPLPGPLSDDQVTAESGDQAPAIF